jgi:hypothetical protein
VLLLDENPSLKPYLSEALSIAYKLGLNLAVRETDLPYEMSPSDCPYSLEATLDDAFLPDS